MHAVKSVPDSCSDDQCGSTNITCVLPIVFDHVQLKTNVTAHKQTEIVPHRIRFLKDWVKIVTPAEAHVSLC